MVYALVICAHNDDQIIGAGGALAKYAYEGRYFKTVIFSYGELSHPHLQSEVIAKRRIAECVRGNKILGGSGIAFLGLQEGHFLKNISGTRASLLRIIRSERPERIFTHSANDLHPDHHAVFRIVSGLLGKIDCPVFCFEVWTLFSFYHRSQPKLVVNVSSFFKRKMRAFLAHESQRFAILALAWKTYFVNRLAGFRYGFRFAEVFRRLK